MKKYEFFKVEGDKINRIRRHCPKCGPAVFLAEHKDRFGCGKCGYTEFKGGSRKQPEPQPGKSMQKPVEQQPTAEVKEETPVPEESEIKPDASDEPKKAVEPEEPQGETSEVSSEDNQAEP